MRDYLDKFLEGRSDERGPSTLVGAHSWINASCVEVSVLLFRGTRERQVGQQCMHACCVYLYLVGKTLYRCILLGSYTRLATRRCISPVSLHG